MFSSLTTRSNLPLTKAAKADFFRPDPRYEWEQQRVAGVQILVQDGWFYSFYIGYRDIDHAQIGLARSHDGLSHWERSPANPIIRATGSGFDALAG